VKFSKPIARVLTTEIEIARRDKEVAFLLLTTGKFNHSRALGAFGEITPELRTQAQRPYSSRPTLYAMSCPEVALAYNSYQFSLRQRWGKIGVVRSQQQRFLSTGPASDLDSCRGNVLNFPRVLSWHQVCAKWNGWRLRIRFTRFAGEIRCRRNCKVLLKNLRVLLLEARLSRPQPFVQD
jgi:hypothetical protein